MIIGNWKMNPIDPSDVEKYFKTFKTKNNKVGFSVPAIYLKEVCAMTSFPVFAQNIYFEDNGPYTGELSSIMVKSVGAKGSLVGHHERRKYFAETDEDCFKKVQALLKHDLTAVICIGESLQEKQDKRVFESIEKQLSKILTLPKESLSKHLVIAYEPVWAIGTGHSATTQEIEDVHTCIRSLCKDFTNIPIIYGGSVTSQNSAEILKSKNVNGVLVGKASLDPTEFEKICDSQAS